MNYIKEEKEKQRKKDKQRHKFIDQLKKIEAEIFRVSAMANKKQWECLHEKLPALYRLNQDIGEFIEEEQKGDDKS